MNIFHAQFSTGQVVAATGVSNSTLQTWLKRNLIVGQKDAPISGGGTPGAHRRFSFFNVMEIAVTKSLVEVGLGVSDAVKAAMHFAHAGQSPIADRRERLPSLPYNTRWNPCFTVLCVAGEKSRTLPWKPGSAGEDVVAIARHVLGDPAGFIILQIDPIFEEVTARLGYDYRDVLSLAYPQADAE